MGVVSTKEPFGRLVSQGMILGEVEYTTCRWARVREGGRRGGGEGRGGGWSAPQVHAGLLLLPWTVRAHVCVRLQHTVLANCVCRDGPAGPSCEERAASAVVERVPDADVERQG